MDFSLGIIPIVLITQILVVTETLFAISFFVAPRNGFGLEIVQAKERSTDLEHQLVRKPHHHRCSVGNVSNHEQLHHALLERIVLGRSHQVMVRWRPHELCDDVDVDVQHIQSINHSINQSTSATRETETERKHQREWHAPRSRINRAISGVLATCSGVLPRF